MITHKKAKKHIAQEHIQLIKQKIPKKTKQFLYFISGIVIGLIIILVIGASSLVAYKKQFQNRIYPGVSLAHESVGGLTQTKVKDLWLEKNKSFENLSFTLRFETSTATISAAQLNLGFDATTSATQAFLIGRSGNLFSDIYHALLAWRLGINLNPLFSWEKRILAETLEMLEHEINIPAENALFEFMNGRVTAFKLAKSGRALDKQLLTKRFEEQLLRIAAEPGQDTTIVFDLPVNEVKPTISDAKNNYGITELIGRGESWFKGSIPGRVHNVALGASRINGILIVPGETFSFNQAIGDISAATGYKQAYVIKSGRTVLDDGGGICQVSTTLFRAALNTGLPITERHAHSYRVGYYEQGGWKPGFDATVYAPSYDLKIQNNTQHHILVQAKADTANTHLIIELYGTKDNRTIELTDARLWEARPAPPDLIQDDPTLPNGQMRQVDWANPGIKAAFDYKVTRNGETLSEKNFFSNYVPWQAVYLRGTKI